VLALAAVGLASMVFTFDTEPTARSRSAGAAAARTGPGPSRTDAARPRPRAEPVKLPPGGISRLRAEPARSQPAGDPMRTAPYALSDGPRARRREMQARLDQVAEARGWSARKTESIGALLRETLDGAEQRLAGITERSQWAGARREVVRFRQTQALRIAEELGDEDYRAFVEEMQLSRIPSPTGQPGVRWMPLRIKDVE